MIDPILQRRVKEPNHKFKKRKNDEVKFDRRLKENKIKYINTFKRKQICIVCGESSYCCLEFHHLNRENKLFTISSAICNIKIGMRQLKDELKKCVIICSNCHKKLHFNEMNVGLLQEILNTR